MLKKNDEHLGYREIIGRCARACAAGDFGGLEGLLDRSTPLNDPDFFVDGNRGKRRMKLERSLDLLSEGFDGLAELLREYVDQCPLRAYDDGTRDADRFLAWLAGRRRLDDVEGDLVTCQQARLAIERAGRLARASHLRFTSLWSRQDAGSGRGGFDGDVTVHFNPVHAWATLRSDVFLDDGVNPPAGVVFCAVGDEIRTAILDIEGRGLARALDRIAPCSVDTWVRECGLDDRGPCIEFAEAGVLIGLIAVDGD